MYPALARFAGPRGRLNDTFKIYLQGFGPHQFFHHIDSPDQAGCPQRPRDARTAIRRRVSPHKDS